VPDDRADTAAVTELVTDPSPHYAFSGDPERVAQRGAEGRRLDFEQVARLRLCRR
jgi:hypothetical protein